MKGQKANVGDQRVAPNGYHYTRTEVRWELTHKLVAEASLGRTLREGERCRFRDGDRTNLHPDNIEVYTSVQRSVSQRIAQLEARKADIEGEIATLVRSLESQ